MNGNMILAAYATGENLVTGKDRIATLRFRAIGSVGEQTTIFLSQVICNEKFAQAGIKVSETLSSQVNVTIIPADELSVDLKTLGGISDPNVDINKQDKDDDEKITLKDIILYLQEKASLRR